MKVVFLVRDLGLGGVERCVTLVAAGLVARGIDARIVMLGGQRNVWEASAVPVIDLSAHWHSKKPWTWLRGWQVTRAELADADVVIAATFLLPLYMGWAATRGLSARFIAWVHGPMAELDAFARMNPIHRFACQFIYRRMAELLFVSDHSRQSLARWLGMPVQAGWRVMPNFVAPNTQTHTPTAPRLDRMSAYQEPRIYGTQPPLQLLFVGRIASEKQPYLWLDTLEALAARSFAAELTVLGEGPLQEWVVQEAERRQLKVRIQSHIGGVSAAMQNADWLLLTSNFEGFGLVVLEAMQLGLPVVSTNSGGVCDFFADRLDEFITAETSGSALAEKIVAQLAKYNEIAAWEIQRSQDYAPDLLLQRWLAYLQG